MRELVPDLMLLFDGDRKSYGMYGIKLNDDGGGKLKSTAKSVKGDVTIELWIGHLAGQFGLGIIPINQESKVKFAAIDVDDYTLDLQELNARIQKVGLPLVVVRTKSGGAHLFLFLETFTNAGEVQTKMREFASMLGLGHCEIFPKQTKIVVERGDVGSWINMPYQNSIGTSRYALDAAGEKLNFVQFMAYVKSKIVDFEKIRSMRFQTIDLLPGGPPCLNHLVSMGFPAGTRNNGLFNLAVYAYKAHGDDWEKKVMEYNTRFMDPPLDASEVQGVIKSVLKKEFFYMCKQPPIAQYCNMPKCRGCKHGIGSGDLGMPKFGSLTKLNTKPPIWFLEVEGGGRMELSTEDLQSPRNFQNKCMEYLNIMPILPKMMDWQEIISKLLEHVNIIDVPTEATPVGQLRLHLEDFCTSRVQAKTADELILGKPWTHNGFVYFRLRDFLSYLERQKFKTIPGNYVAMHLNDFGCGKKFWNLRGKGCNTYMIAAKEFNKQTEAFDTPEIEDPTKAIT